MNEKILKAARDYLDNVSPEELKENLVECGLYTITNSPNPIYKKGVIKMRNKSIINSLIQNNIPPLILGKPGIGKSAIVKQIAEEMANKKNKIFIDIDKTNLSVNEILSNKDNYFIYKDLRLSGMDISDLIGLPIKNDKIIEYVPLKWIIICKECESFIFLDEITNISDPSVESAAYGIILDKKCGDTYLGENTYICAAGNTTSSSSISCELSNPLINRFGVIYMDPIYNEWLKWMEENNPRFDRRVQAFLDIKTELFIQLPTTSSTDKNFPTPRTWEKVATLKDPNNKELLISLLGDDVGLAYYTFINITVDLDEINNNPKLLDGLNIEQKYTVYLVLANNVDKYENILKYMINNKMTEAIVCSLMYSDKNKKINDKDTMRTRFVNKLIKMDKSGKIINTLKEMSIITKNVSNK